MAANRAGLLPLTLSPSRRLPKVSAKPSTSPGLFWTLDNSIPRRKTARSVHHMAPGSGFFLAGLNTLSVDMTQVDQVADGPRVTILSATADPGSADAPETGEHWPRPRRSAVTGPAVSPPQRLSMSSQLPLFRGGIRGTAVMTLAGIYPRESVRNTNRLSEPQW